MRTFLGTLLLLGAMMTTPLLAQAGKPASHLEIAVTYDAARSNAAGGNSFWLQGGGVQVHGQLWNGLGAVGDFVGLNKGNINNSGVGLDMVVATFGPRYTWSPAHGRFSLYGQGLGGVVNGFNSTFPNVHGAQSSATGLAFQIGGGMNFRLKPHFALRVVEADWLRTDLPNAGSNAQNNLRLGSGLIFRF